MSTITEKPLGFIGLGTMGSRMADRLLAGGLPLTVYNRTRAKAEALAAKGAAVAETPRELAAVCDYIMISLTDDEAVEAVFHGPRGILAGGRAGAACIDLSTIGPRTCSKCSRKRPWSRRLTGQNWRTRVSRLIQAPSRSG
jgi:3-hydroxyisobutyrate dehydrogenase